MFANASADPLFLPGGERHVLRKVFGSQFIMSSAHESAGIQAVDVVLWLFKRVLSGDDLPSSSARLMRFVFRRARQHDFSFAGVSERLKAMFDDLWARPLSEEQLENAAKLLDKSERQRQENMIQYEEAKRLEALESPGAQEIQSK